MELSISSNSYLQAACDACFIFASITRVIFRSRVLRQLLCYLTKDVGSVPPLGDGTRANRTFLQRRSARSHSVHEDYFRNPPRHTLLYGHCHYRKAIANTAKLLEPLLSYCHCCKTIGTTVKVLPLLSRYGHYCQGIATTVKVLQLLSRYCRYCQAIATGVKLRQKYIGCASLSAFPAANVRARGSQGNNTARLLPGRACVHGTHGPQLSVTATVPQQLLGLLFLGPKQILRYNSPRSSTEVLATEYL